MELLIITWLCIAHIIYFFLAVMSTNDRTLSVDLNELLIEQYVTCLSWPVLILVGLIFVTYITVTYLLLGLDWLYNYVGEIYWDLQTYYAYLQEMVLIEEREFDGQK